MPKPERGHELITLTPGAPDFRRGNWWSTYKEARVFYPVGFDNLMAAFNLNSIDPLVAFTDAAARSIAETIWQVDLPVRSHWTDCARGQLVFAAEQKPMLLSKAVLAIEAMQLYADSIGAGVDVWNELRIVAAAYRPEGWTIEAHKTEKESRSPAYMTFMTKALAMGQTRPDLILHELAQKYHGTFELVKLIKDTFTNYDIVIETAKRPGQSGVWPASSQIVPL